MTAHIASKAFYCADCHKTYPTGRGFGTGYAVIEDDYGKKTICYDCADQRERQFVASHNVWVGYLSVDGGTLTTWSGGRVMTVANEKRPVHERLGCSCCDLSERLTYLRAIDDQGKRWYGKCAGRGMVVRMHRVKADRVPEQTVQSA